MTARLTAQLVLLMLPLSFFIGCGGDGAPTDDQPPSTSDAASFGRGDNVDSTGVEDEFGAAPPVSADTMAPFGPADPGRPELVRERPEASEIEHGFGPAAPDVLTPVEGERYPDLFAEARAAEAGKPTEPVGDEEDGFTAAPPVAVTDAAVPIPGVEETAGVEPAAVDLVDSAPAEVTPAAVELPAVEAPCWPRFHGPNGDNKSPDKGLLKKWPEGGPQLLWSANGIGQGYSSVTLANGAIFTAGNTEEGTVVTALDLDGATKWQFNNGPAWTASVKGSRGTPTVDGDRVYHQSPLGNVVCLKAESGEKIWGMNCLDEFDGKNITWALSESLLIDGDHVICCPGGRKASVAALDKMTGATIWTAESTGDKAGYCSPTLVEYDGLRMILVMTSGAFIGVNADTGKLLFRHPFRTQYDVNVLKPIFQDGQVFISGGYGTTGSQLLSVNVEGDDVSVELVWESRDMDNHHGGVVLLDGYLYGAAHKFNNSKWVCLDWKTGAQQWAERGVGKGSLTYADGMLYLMNEARRVGLAKPSPDGHEVISEFGLPSGSNDKSWAHPVVIGGRLYIRHDDRLFAYDVRASG